MKRVHRIVLTAFIAIVLMVVQIVIIKNAAQYEPEVEVVIVNKRIPANTTITENMLIVKKFHISIVNKLAARNISDVVGMVAKVDLEVGEQILKSRLITADTMKILPLENEVNKLFNLEIKVDQSNNFLRVGQYVDIFFVPNSNTNLSNLSKGSAESMIESDSMSEALKLVYKLDHIRIAAILDDRGNVINSESSSLSAKYICVEVTADTAQYLSYCKHNGKIEYALTN